MDSDLDEMNSLEEIGKKAKLAKARMARLKTGLKNKVLEDAAARLLECAETILEENRKDVEAALAAGTKGAFIDRLTLTKERVAGMADGLRQVAALPDPVGEVTAMKTIENGLAIGQKRVPMGVIGIIYEARPNVTADAFGLCFKAGSAVVLRGGKEAVRSNAAIVSVFQQVLSAHSLPPAVVQLVMDASRETAVKFMKLNEYVDVLIPRGGGGLIRTVVENSTIPVIETGTGNCHIFVDASADLDRAVDIVVNAKVQRPGVCNAVETLLVHENVAGAFLPAVCEALRGHGVELRGDEAVAAAVSGVVPATEEDWRAEYLDLILAIGVVKDLDAALAHIAAWSSGHSEAILTESYANSQRFLNEVDSACVYVNASTRFTDGEQFGLGAEIGISTQKLHARGPMGLKELTSLKYVIYGDGQVRE